MRQIFWISIFVFTLTLSNNVLGQLVWQENFDVPDKGIWANAAGEIITDTSDVGWSINVEGCEFSNESDYAKTVTTNGGRFEVLDSDGEVLWLSEPISISDFDIVNVSLFASETGSSSAADKKYINAFTIIDGGTETPFSPVSEFVGDWGGGELTTKALHGNVLQIAVRLNSSYASDKVFIDNVLVEAFDSTTLIPVSLKVIECPLFAFSGDTVQIRAAAYNVNGEMLIDSSLKLSLTIHDFNVVGNFYSDGIYSWKTITTKNGELGFAVSISDWPVESIDSSIIIFNKEEAKVIQNYEGSAYQDWELGADWAISDIEPISGQYSVKHSESASSVTSVLKYNSGDIRLTEEEYFFSFKLKNGKWDPSSSNGFYVFLKTEENKGYIIGVNASGSSDLVSVWKANNGEAAELIAETSFDWDESTLAQFNIIRNPWGEWILNVSDLNTGESASAEFVDAEFQIVNKIELVFNYTASRAGTLWFDDFVLIGQNAAPFIANVKVLDSGKFEVIFNEDINWNSVSTSNFAIRGASGQVYGVEKVEKNSENTAIISTTEIHEATIVLTATNITDLDGKTTLESVFEFENALPAAETDVVFTEIMADPTPVVALPNAEYLEIYNRSNKYIQLEDWILFVRNTDWKLPKRLLSPGEYLILCDTDFENDFGAYGNVLAIDNFPSLLNAGVTIRLTSSEGIVADEITYSEEWYFDNQKDNGGYSLERIDENRFCGQRGNWIASNHPDGGTPGEANSVQAENIDKVTPVLDAVDIVSYTQINAIFSEPVDSISATIFSNYLISGVGIQRIEYQKGSLEVAIHLKDQLKINQEYSLVVKNISDECGNVLTESELPFAMVTLKAGDILINEVLFNPYTNGSDFVELYNNSGLTLDLADLKLATRDDTLKLKSVYDVSKLHVRFPAGEYFLFTGDTANIKSTYHIEKEENLFQMEKFPAYNNDEGRVVLLTDSLLVVDELAYSENMHSDWLTAYDGVSLERLSLDDETNSLDNWGSASSVVGYATPTYANSQTKIDEGQSIAVELESDVISPNGDGYNDELILTYKLDKTDYVVNLFVFDAVGREVRRLMNNDLIGNLNQITYDLTTEDGQLLSMGVYVTFSELVHLSGEKKVFKNAFLVTDKK